MFELEFEVKNIEWVEVWLAAVPYRLANASIGSAVSELLQSEIALLKPKVKDDFGIFRQLQASCRLARSARGLGLLELRMTVLSTAVMLQSKTGKFPKFDLEIKGKSRFGWTLVGDILLSTFISSSQNGASSSSFSFRWLFVVDGHSVRTYVHNAWSPNTVPLLWNGIIICDSFISNAQTVVVNVCCGKTTSKWNRHDLAQTAF